MIKRKDREEQKIIENHDAILKKWKTEKLIDFFVVWLLEYKNRINKS